MRGTFGRAAGAVRVLVSHLYWPALNADGNEVIYPSYRVPYRRADPLSVTHFSPPASYYVTVSSSYANHHEAGQTMMRKLWTIFRVESNTSANKKVSYLFAVASLNRYLNVSEEDSLADAIANHALQNRHVSLYTTTRYYFGTAKEKGQN